MKKDFIFKTIEFSRTTEETEYYLTYLEPVIPDEEKNKYPNHRFVYTSQQEMETDLQTTLNYSMDYIANLYVNQVTYYYSPLYTTKWYIAGLYDHMHDSVYGKWKNMFSYDLVKDAQNKHEGYVFPQKLQKLIWNKPINRIRARIMEAPQITNMVSEVSDFNDYKWRRLIGNTIAVQNGTETTYIHFGYINLEMSATDPEPPEDGKIQYKEAVRVSSTKTIYLYQNIGEDTQLLTSPNALGPYSAIGVLAYSSESSEILKAKEYTFSLLDANPKMSDLEKVYGDGVVKLMDGKYNIYIRHRNNINDSLHINSHYKSNLSWKKYTQRCIYIADDPDTATPENSSNYTTITNNIIRVRKNDKIYYQYIRYSNDMQTLSDSHEGMKYIAVSAYNISDNKTNLAYNTPENFTFFSLNVPCDNITSAVLHYKNYYWVQYGLADIDIDDDTENPNATYDYAIYNNIVTYKKLYLRIQKSLNNATKPDKNSHDITIIFNDINPLNGSVAISENEYLYIAFSDTWPPLSTRFLTDLYYSINNTTKYIGISYTDELGEIHPLDNLSLAPGEYVWFPLSDDMKISVGDYVKVDKPKYFYYTFSNDRADIYDRQQTPVCTTKNNSSYELFGYMFDMSILLKKDREERITFDRTEKSFSLYKSDAWDFYENPDQHIEQIATIRVPFSAMGKYSVFNFDTVTLHTGEYLIIGGNRDTIGICIPELNFSEENDYSYSNEDTVTPDEERPKVNGTIEMFYYAVNYINDQGWEGEQYKKLPVDIGCSYAITTTAINLTTQTYKEIYEQSRLNDERSLQNYKNSQENKYTPPNYDLYVNLTYKFSKITDGNHEYLPLFNRYKIQCQFKNEFQEVVGEKTKFDVSLMTYDGSIYNKPELIYIDNISYGPTTQEYYDYMTQFEVRLYQTIRQTDIESGQRDYDVGFMQYNNILYQLFPIDYSSPNHKEYDKLGYYNYKTIADNKYVNDLPVVCTVTVLAFETATPIFTKNIPVSLAAYSLVEITDDYIKSTVSKIEYDYLYGLTQRISRIEQYADRISMSVQNVGQGLYSQLQMTEDEIRMQVIDTSKNIGSLFSQTAESITALVYDVSKNTISKIEMLSSQILLEVSGNLTRSGILLKEDSALIYAPDIVLDGDKTTIMGSLQVREKNDTGISVFDSSNIQKVFINGKNITETESNFSIGQTDFTSEKRINFLEDNNDIESIKDEKKVTGDFNSGLIASQVFGMFTEKVQYATTYSIDELNFSYLTIKNKDTGQTYYYKDLFETTINNLIITVWKKGVKLPSAPTSTQSLSYMTNMQIYDDSLLYGATSSDIYWVVNGIKRLDEAEIYVYVNATSDYELPEFKVETTKNIEDCAIEVKGNNTIIKESSMRVITEDNYKIVKFELSSVIGEMLLYAVLSEKSEDGKVVDSISTYIKVTSVDAKVIKWILNDSEVTEFTVNLAQEFAEILYPMLWKANDINDGMITYESTDTSIANIDSSTGEITLLDIVGSTIISASVRITGNYKYTASYTLNVIIGNDAESGESGGFVQGEGGQEGWNIVSTLNISNLKLSSTNNFIVNTYINSNLNDIKISIPERGDYIFIFQFDPEELQNAIRGNTTGVDYYYTYPLTTSTSSRTSWNVSSTLKTYDISQIVFDTGYWGIKCYPYFSISGHTGIVITLTNILPKIYTSVPLIYTISVLNNTVLTKTGRVTAYYTTITGEITKKDISSVQDINEDGYPSGEKYIINLLIGEQLEYIEITILPVAYTGGGRPDESNAFVHIHHLRLEYHEPPVNESSGTYIFARNDSYIRFKTAEEQRTVIGANGLYSYLDNKALLYFTTSDLIMRIANTGLRINNTKSDIFKNSMGLELLYNSEGATTYTPGARIDNWTGFHNYSPMIILTKEKWGDYKDLESIGSPGGWNVDINTYNNEIVKDNNIWTIKQEYKRYYRGWVNAKTFYYDNKKYRGSILIQSSQEPPAFSPQQAVSAIELPIYIESYYKAGISDINLPVGYIIKIINVQHKITLDDGVTFGQDYGDKIIVTIDNRWYLGINKPMNYEWFATDKNGNRKYGYSFHRSITGTYKSSSGNVATCFNDPAHTPITEIRRNANFLDAANNIFAAIELPSNFSEVSFIWTGYVWKYSGIADEYSLDELKKKTQTN